MRRISFTKAGRKRLEHIKCFLFEEAKIHRNIETLQKYTLVFQNEEPMIHLVHEQLKNIYGESLSFFVRPEVLVNKSTKSHCQLNLDETAVQLPLDSIFSVMQETEC